MRRHRACGGGIGGAKLFLCKLSFWHQKESATKEKKIVFLARAETCAEKCLKKMYDSSVKTYYRTAGKFLIGGFCIWHMFAVFAYTIPNSISKNVSSTLQHFGMKEEDSNVVETLRWEIAGPYMLRTSQWQQWNMFSADPSRTVVTMAVEKQVNAAMWQTIRIIDPEYLSWWQHSREIKMLYALGMDSGEGPLERFILPSECRLFGLPKGTNLRLIRNRYLIPQADIPRDAQFWRTFAPNPLRTVRSNYTCPAL